MWYPGKGDPGSGFTGCDFGGGKLVPTFAYLYSGAVMPPHPTPTPGCLCSINLWNRAQFVISPWSLFLLISLQNRSTWMLLFKSLMCSSCQAVVWAASSALTRQWELVFICWLHCQGRKHCRKRQQKNTTVELQAESLGRGHVCRRENLCDQ